MLKLVRNILLALFLFAIFWHKPSAYSADANLNLNVVDPGATYTITTNINGRGMVLPGQDVEVSSGETQTIEFIADEGYFIDSILIDGISMGAISSYTFVDVMQSHIINASFQIMTYSIIAATGNVGGQISPEGQVWCQFSDSREFNIVPDVGYEIDYVLVDEINRGALSKFLFENIAGDHSIKSYFKRSSFVISASAAPGGKISPSGDTIVNRGEAKKFTITPDEDYVVSDVLVDNVSVGPLSEYIFNNINGDHSVLARFSQTKAVIRLVDVKISGSAGGSVTPDGDIKVEEGSDLILLIRPDEGFAIASIKINNQLVEIKDIIELKNILNSTQVEVLFEAKKDVVRDVYLINMEFDSNALSEPIYKSVSAYFGETRRISFVAKEGYQIEEIIIDNQFYRNITKYDFFDIQANHYIKIVTQKIADKESTSEKIIDDVIKTTSDSIAKAAQPINNIMNSIGVDEKSAPTFLNASSAIIIGAGSAAAPIVNLSVFSGQEIIRSIWYSFFSLVTRKKRKRWGNVLDYNTGIPIFQAEVKIFRVESNWKSNPTAKKFVSSTFTDNQGGFAFIVEPGRYILEVIKKDLFQFSAEGFYHIGEEIEVKNEKEGLIVPTIAMVDNSGNFSKKSKVIILANKLEKYSPLASIFCLLLGTVTSVDSLLKESNLLSVTMVVVCLVMWAITFRNFSKKSPWGKVAEKKTEKSVPLALVRFFNANDNRLIKTAITDQTGKYQVIVPKGRYNIMVSKQGYKLSKDIRLVTENHSDIINRKIELEQIS